MDGQPKQYAVEFCTSVETTEDQANTLEYMSGFDAPRLTVAEIVDTCEEFGVSAEFFDPATGAKKGEAKADGHWRYV